MPAADAPLPADAHLVNRSRTVVITRPPLPDPQRWRSDIWPRETTRAAELRGHARQRQAPHLGLLGHPAQANHAPGAAAQRAGYSVLLSNSRFNRAVGGSEPMKVARTARENTGSVIVPSVCPFIAIWSPARVKASVLRSPALIAGTASRKRSTSEGARWHGARQFFSNPSLQTSRACLASTSCPESHNQKLFLW